MSDKPSITLPPRCTRCSEVIGVYEPAIWVMDDGTHETSRAADPDLPMTAPFGCYHADCYAPEQG